LLQAPHAKGKSSWSVVAFFRLAPTLFVLLGLLLISNSPSFKVLNSLELALYPLRNNTIANVGVVWIEQICPMTNNRVVGE